MFVSLRAGIAQDRNSCIGFSAFLENALHQRLQNISVMGRIFRNNQYIEAHKAPSSHPSANRSPSGCRLTISTKFGIVDNGLMIDSPVSSSLLQKKVVS